MGDQSWPRRCRITETRDYRRLYDSGSKVVTSGFILFHGPAATGASRIGLSSSRKVGKAVVRNRVKRRMREVVRRLRPLLLREADLVVVARARAAGFGYRRMEEDLVRLLTMARLLPR